MRKPKKFHDNPNQPSLFDVIIRNNPRLENSHQGGSLDADKALRAAISEAIKNGPSSRPHVAAKMSELTGDEITVSMINNWSAESKKPWNFPAKYLPALYSVTKSAWLFRVLANLVDLYIMESPDALRAETAAIDEQIIRLKKAKQKRQVLLKMMEAPPGQT